MPQLAREFALPVFGAGRRFFFVATNVNMVPLRKRAVYLGIMALA